MLCSRIETEESVCGSPGGWKFHSMAVVHGATHGTHTHTHILAGSFNPSSVKFTNAGVKLGAPVLEDHPSMSFWHSLGDGIAGIIVNIVVAGGGLWGWIYGYVRH